MTSVVPLKDANAEPDQDTVEALQEALELAQSGKLRTVAIVGDLTGNKTFTSYSTKDLITLMGMLWFMMHKLGAKMETLKDG